MELYKESLLNKIEDDLTGRNQNWDAIETHLADYDAHVAESAQKHIAESGSNDDGYWIKFDDGTMIAYCNRITIPSSELSAGSRVVKDIILPQPFTIKISTDPGMYVNTSNDIIAINYIATLFSGASKVVVRHANVNTNTAAVYLNPVIIGRWK